MLQCSNYKPRKTAFVPFASGGFYQRRIGNASCACAWRYLRVQNLAGAPYLRNLLSLAARLRQLANDAHCLGDQALYLMTAEALEKRAEWLAATLPSERIEEHDRPRLHTPIDMTI